MKRLFRIFVLSKSEQRAVVLIVLTLIVVALVGYQRRAHQFPIQLATATEPKALPTPAELKDEQ
jgi:hypothetical protein